MWDGLCYNDQQQIGQRLTNVTLQECQEMCTLDPLCKGFASNPSNFCWLTSVNDVMSDENLSANTKAKCYAKITGIYNKLITLYCRNILKIKYDSNENNPSKYRYDVYNNIMGNNYIFTNYN